MSALYGDNIFNEKYNENSLNKWREFNREQAKRHNEKVKTEKRYKVIDNVITYFEEYLDSKNMPSHICSIYTYDNTRSLFVKEDISYILLEAEVRKSDKASKEIVEAAKKKLKEIMTNTSEISSYLNSHIHDFHIYCKYEDEYCIKVNIY